MIMEQRILDFEKMGLGMFVHFGLYSLLEQGEWTKEIHKIPDEDYEPLMYRFSPAPDWAKNLARTAADAGCKYITLTTRHHDGFSLYDTCGLSDYDAPHGCGRDLVREFVDACREAGLKPFFYHTLLDWHHPDFNTDFPQYLNYLRSSVELLCTRYGEIGGIWFDGKWSRPQDDWEEDALYGMIRRHQPDTILINNTGTDARGALGHPELDSVTFECGRPQPINLSESPKYIASEMCQTLALHWGYAKNDLNFKSMGQILEDLAVCRRYGSNLLLNVGPRGDGSLRLMDQAIFEGLGTWVRFHEEALRLPRPTDIPVENRPKDFLLRSGNDYYLFIHSDSFLPQDAVEPGKEVFLLDRKVRAVTCLYNGAALPFTQEGNTVTVHAARFPYGTDLVIQAAKIETE